MIKNIIGFLVLTFSILSAQDFSGIRIYINPGHGGTDPANDRYIPETGFWESEGNLGKGLHLMDILKSLNATVKISRTTNYESDDLGLSVISADANNFGADYFQSIHSNATGISSKRNTTLVLYRGYTDTPVFTQAKAMADIVANQIYTAHRTTSYSIYGDWSFYPDWGTQGLGVLRGLTMPGTLSEGSFHDYIPESWRLKNDAYLKHEAWAFTKSFIEYFNLDDLPTGEIAGILRDPNETVAYYYLPGTNDGKKPLNYSSVSLLNDSLLYEGDEFNNGFYLIDNLSPGTYNLVLSADGYNADTVSVNVIAGQTSFKDDYINPLPDYSIPEVIDFQPALTEDVSLGSNFIFEFNVKMDKNSVQNAFSIEPNVAGNFTWEFNDKRMIFTPTDFLESATTYNILISNTAKSFYDVPMSDFWSQSFTTKQSLKLVKSYPDKGETDVSPTVKIKLKFNNSIDFNSLGGRVSLEDLLGNEIELSIDEEDYEGGWIIFSSYNPLNYNSYYRIKLLKGISDTEETILDADTTIFFKTESYKEILGSVILDFENLDNWNQPSESPLSQNINSSSTSFMLSSLRKIDGSKSGNLIYEFTNSSNGVCQILNSTEIEIPGESQDFGIWVYGDFSGNVINYLFINSLGENISFLVDTLDWTGWKFKSVDLSNNDNLFFNSIIIEQGEYSENSGILYFDNAVINSTVSEADVKSETLITDYKLFQNYPNPFNPTTTIRYSIPTVETHGHASVQLKIYDVLGKQIATLVNKIQPSGNYEINFDAANLPSGVYYYQLKAGNYVQTKKMVLLK